MIYEFIAYIQETLSSYTFYVDCKMGHKIELWSHRIIVFTFLYFELWLGLLKYNCNLYWEHYCNKISIFSLLLKCISIRGYSNSAHEKMEIFGPLPPLNMHLHVFMYPLLTVRTLLTQTHPSNKKQNFI
jgi:hypothetical protein